MSLRVTVWNEGIHDRENETTRELYPDGIGGTIAAVLREAGHEAEAVTLEDPEQGLDEERLAETEVLVWWAHVGHDQVDDEAVDRVVDRVHEGMGFVPLHSAHYSKPFRRLLGTDCDLKWREAEERERLWAVNPGHPIVDGLDEQIVVPEAEMYGEPFGIPEPEEQVFVSWFEGGEVFRSGCCWRRERGKIFYFRPGHETYPVYHQSEIQQVLVNAVEWAAPDGGATFSQGHTPDPSEPLE